jgi:hypothetical protein
LKNSSRDEAVNSCQSALSFSPFLIFVQPLRFFSSLDFGRRFDYKTREMVTHDNLGNSSQLGRLFILGPNDPVLGVCYSSATAQSDQDGHTSNENFGLRVRGHIKYMYMYKE